MKNLCTRRHNLCLLSLLLCAQLFISTYSFAQCSGTAFTVSPTQCAGQSISFTNTSSNIADASTYEWNFKDGSTKVTTANASHIFASAGTYKVSLIRTCPNAAKDSATISVVVNAKPAANDFTFSPSGQCSENAISFFTTSPAGGMTYNWNFGDPASTRNTSKTKDTTHIFEAYGTATQNFSVALTTTDSKGCFAGTTKSVSVKQRPDLQVSELNNFKTCIANLATGVSADVNLFNDTPDPSKSSVTNYKINWGDATVVENKTNATFDNGTGITHNYSVLNRYNISIEASGANGCKTTKVFPYLVDANPVANLEGPPSGTNSGCGPLTVMFTNKSSNVSSTTQFFFTPGDGSPAIQLPTGVTNNTISYTYKSSCINGALQSLTAKLKAQNECDSATSTWSPIKVYPQPIADFVAAAPFCKNSAITFTNNSIPNRCAANAATKYTWNWGDGTVPQIFNNVNAALSPQQSLTHTYADTGTYVIVLKAENNSTNGCGFTTDTLIIKVSDKPLADFTANKTTGCAPLAVTFTNASKGINMSYSWSIIPASGFTFTGGTTAASVNPQISFTNTGSYEVTMIATTPCGTSIKKETIIVKDKPTITFPASPAAQCAPATFTQASFLPVIGSSGGTISTYLWNFAGGTASNTNTANPGSVKYNTANGYTISLTATNECGSTAQSVSNFFTVGTPPVANAGKDSAICSGNQAQIGSVALANHLYSWSPTTGLSNPASSNPTAILTNSGNSPVVTKFKVTVSANGCTNTDSVDVLVNPFPTVSAGADTSLCKTNASFKLSKATPVNGTWSGGAYVNAAGIFNTTGLAAGVYTVNYTFKDASTKCEATKSKTVTIQVLPVVEAGGPSAFCNTSTVETLAGFSPAGGTWSGLGVTASGDFTPSVVGVKTGHKLFYSFTDANTCSALDSLILNITVPPSVAMGADVKKCINDPAFTLVSPTPTGGAWTVTPYLTASGLLDPKLAGVGTVTITYTTAGTASCQSSGTKDVLVSDTVVVTAGSNDVACSNQAVFTLTGFSPAGGSWTSLPAGYVTGNDFDPSKAGTITSDVTVALTYKVTDGTTGCISKDGKTVTVKPVPKVDVSLVPTTFCTKDTLINLGALPAGGTWTGDGIVGNLFNPNTAGTGPHTLNYKIASGTCTDDKDVNITINPLVKPSAGSDFAICIDAAIKTHTGFNPAGGTWSGAGISGNTFNPATATAGTYDLVYSTGAGTCKASDSLQAKVNPIPVISVGTNPQGVCEGAPAFNLAGWSPNAGGTWGWTGTGITNATLGTFDPSVSGPGSFILTFTFTDAITSCDDAQTKTVNVNALPTLAFALDDSICTQKNLTIVNSSTGTNLSSAWSLKPVAGFTFTSGTNAGSVNPILTFTNAGTYQVTLKGQTGAGCLDSLTHPVVVVDPPVVKFSKDKDKGCGPFSVLFTNQSSGVLKSYLWDFGNGQTSTASAPGTVIFAPSKTQDTTYYVSLRLTSSSCDDVVFKDSVVVFPKPNVVFGPDKNIGCSPAEIKFKNNTTGRPDSFVWNYGDGTPNSTTAASLHTHFFKYSGTKDTTYTVSLTATNTCGSDMATASIKVLPNTVKAFFNTDVFEGCVPLTVNFTNFSTGGTNIKWDLGDNNVTNTVSPSHTYTAAGEYFVTLYVNNGCSFDTTKPAVKIRVNPAPLVKFSIVKSIICESNTAIFTDQSADLKQYIWDFGDGGTSTQTNPTHVYNTTGIYNVILKGQSASTNCFASDTAVIDVRQKPVPQYTADLLAGCQPMLVNFKNTSANSVNHTWDFGDGNTLGSTGTDFAFTFNNPGVFNVKLYSFNSLGCVDSTTQTITVNPKPTAAFDFNPKTACKYPVKVQTTNKSLGYVNSDWTFGNGQTSILNNPFVFYNSIGTYAMQLIVTSSKGCKDTADAVFNAYPLPVTAFTGIPVSGCEPLLVSFQNTTQFASAYVWDFGDGSTPSKLENPLHIYDKEGVYTVKLIATGNNVCTDSVQRSKYIEVLNRPDAGFTYVNNNNPVPHGEIQFTNITTDAISYIWDFGDGNTSTEKTPTHKYDTYGNVLVKLIAKNAIGCSDTTSTLILVDFYKGLWVPTALTPDNGSQETRLFFPKGKGLAKYKLQIYDNWGILIWETDKLENGSPVEGWDGIGQSGTPMPPDVYVWKVFAEFDDGTLWQGQNLRGGSKSNTVGTVTLIR